MCIFVLQTEVTRKEWWDDCLVGCFLFVTKHKIIPKTKTRKSETRDNKMIIFAPPKQGGILQSSGFLDLRSLISLSRTCKTNAFDVLSLILLIENEITRFDLGRVETVEAAIDFLRNIYRYPLLKQWLERDINRVADSIQITRELLSDVLAYEVMLAKMLKTVPTQAERLELVSEQDKKERTLLHNAARAGNPESTKTMLAVYPKSEYFQALGMKDVDGLHCIVQLELATLRPSKLSLLCIQKTNVCRL